MNKDGFVYIRQKDTSNYGWKITYALLQEDGEHNWKPTNETFIYDTYDTSGKMDSWKSIKPIWIILNDT